MRLNTLFDENQIKKTRKRVGRGPGSGKGKTCGAGHKGQKARSGVSIKGFEGGQMPINRRLPKRGFNSLNKEYFKTVNLIQIERLIKENKLKADKITKLDLYNNGLISKANRLVKILATGDLSHKIVIEADAVSKTALDKIKKLNGDVVLLIEESVSQ